MFLFFTDDDFAIGSNFIILCGAPGSGKSTFASKMCSENSKWILISLDRIREKVTGDRNNRQGNKETFNEVYKEISDNLKNKKNVIYDATNTNKYYREKLIKMMKPISNKIVGLVSDKTLLECVVRNKKSNYPIPYTSIESMYVELLSCPPSLKEGFDAIAIAKF